MISPVLYGKKGLVYTCLMQLKDALTTIHKTRDRKGTVNIEFVTADLTRKTGGEFRLLRNVYEVPPPNDHMAHGTITLKRIDDTGHDVSIHTSLIMKVNNEFVN